MSKAQQLDPVGNSLSAKQRRAILLIASGHSTDEVADAVSVSKGTVHNWRSQNADFRRELEETQQMVYEDGIRQLQTLVADACATLRSILVNPAARDYDRISAAKVVLHFAESPLSFDTPRNATYAGVDGYLKRMGID